MISCLSRQSEALTLTKKKKTLLKNKENKHSIKKLKQTLEDGKTFPVYGLAELILPK
jgi:hypothetical protein